MIAGKIFQRSDGSYVLGVSDSSPQGSYHSTETSGIPKSEVETYLASLSDEERSKVLIPEPLPPEPTPAELAAQEEARIEADEAEKDRAFGRAFRKAAEAGEVSPIESAKAATALRFVAKG